MKLHMYLSKDRIVMIHKHVTTYCSKPLERTKMTYCILFWAFIFCSSVFDVDIFTRFNFTGLALGRPAFVNGA